jgi:hypothetical protein
MATTMTRAAPAQTATSRQPPAAPSPHAAFEARANERAALQSAVVRLQTQLAEAVAARDRAIARKVTDGSAEARAAAEAAVGTVVRAEAELSAVRSALARLEAQAAENAALAEKNREAANVKAAAAAAAEMITLAGEADSALAAFLAAQSTLGEKLAALHGLTPSRFHDALFGGGNGLTQALLATAAKNQLSAGGVVPRQPFANPITATLSAAVTHFTKPLIEEAASLKTAAVVWD